MKEDLSQALLMAFNSEIRERLNRARQVLLQSPQLGAAQLDALHQEFDSLHGAARAVDCPKLERFGRLLAGYARLLRRRGGADAEDLARLEAAIGFGLGCAGNGQCGDCRADPGELLRDVESRMRRL